MRSLQRCRIAILFVLASLLPLQPGRGSATGLTFTGGLERVGDQSISVKLADRRVIDAMLPNTPALASAAVAARYTMGDEVEIECQPIQPVWEEATSRLQSLEVTAIRFVRRPSREEVARMLEARFREGKNLLARPEVIASAPGRAISLEGAGSKELEHARRVNLEYAENMPNFVADETAKRYRSTARSPSWSLYDQVESEITFRGRRAVRQHIQRNGQPWDQAFEALPGFKWYEGFETEISPLFDPQCPTTIRYQGRSTASGRHLLKYQFQSPVDGCFPFLYFTYQRYNPSRSGHVFIDDASGSLIQVDDEAGEFPSDFGFARREEHMFWDDVKIGESSHLLPVRADFLVVYSDGTRYRVEVEFKNHRHFEASTRITFK
jgi:hypothetical protein